MRSLIGIAVAVMLGWGQRPEFADAARKQKVMGLAGEMDALFAKYFEQSQTPGLVYGVVVDGEVVHVQGWGVSDVEKKTPVGAETVFRIASMTKSFTALAILKLRDAGKLSLEDPVVKWVPEFAGTKLPTRDSAPVTVRQLLTHGAGFPEDNPWGDRQLGIADRKMGEWVDGGIPFSTPPDTAFEYSNYGFGLLGRIVAKVSGRSYESYLEQEILKPLGLKSATLEAGKAPAGRRAVGYGRRDGKYFEIASLPHGAFGAMGGLLIDARDLGKYVAYQLSAEPARDEAEAGPVKRSSLREMQRVWRMSGMRASREGATARGYGYGLGVSQTCEFERVVSHGGGLPGFGSYMMWLPQRGVGMFAMANLTYSGPSAPMMEALLLLEKKGAIPARRLAASPVLESTRKSLLQLWDKWDDKLMDKLAADNLYLDEPRERIAARFAELRGKYTGCRADAPLEPENWLRGEFRIDCEQGPVKVEFTLAPTKPPLVQYLRLFDGEAAKAGHSNRSCAGL
ncbi:MAG: serine hydrolase domain-containing protein [Acidobacteriota bacterium]